MKAVLEIAQTLGPFGGGTLVVAFVALCTGVINDEKVGVKPGTMTAISAALWTISFFGAVFFVNGLRRGIMW